jgi:hypothetical protein
VLIKVVLNKRVLFLSFVLVALFSNNVFGQNIVNLDTIENTVYLGNFKLKTPSLFKSKYTYDPISNKYIYNTKIGTIDIGIPLVLTPDQYRKRVREESIKNYFSEKIDLVFNRLAFETITVTFSDVFKELINHHMLGIVNEDGRKYYLNLQKN